ncbi:MAG TPA: glutamate racemase [Bacteroidales bacterium]|nr:glutamate racemase [Bacteroidales bacterium]
MIEKSDQPIGIFDSGVGGLTVASAIKRLLPDESLIYFGDTAHLPYGDKSKETVTYYSERIAEYLLVQNCKIIVIACNTASANAYERVVKLVRDRAIVINVIDPVIDHVVERKKISNIGVIGTKGTINSATYEKKITERKSGLCVVSMATPLFVPMIEEGFIFDDISNAIIRSYLSKDQLKDIDTLILGCTHYPIIKNQISKFYNFRVDVIDSSKIVAVYLRDVLLRNHLDNDKNDPSYSFYVSDYTDFFKTISKLFFEEDIELKKLNFWS